MDPTNDESPEEEAFWAREQVKLHPELYRPRTVTVGVDPDDEDDDDDPDSTPIFAPKVPE